MNYIRSLFLIFTLASTISLAQKRHTPKKENITAEQALKSEDVKIIAAFIRNHPDDPQIPQLKSKLLQYLTVSKENASSNSNTISVTSPPTKNNSSRKNETKHSPSSKKRKNDETAKILTHIFSNDISLNSSLIEVSNKSDCDITISFSGRKQNYSLNIAKRSKNHILIEKGEYMISSIVCSAQFATNKNIQKDITMVLGN